MNAIKQLYSPNELKVWTAIKEHPYADRFLLMQLTNLSKRSLNYTLSSLCNKNLLVKVKPLRDMRITQFLVIEE